MKTRNTLVSRACDTIPGFNDAWKLLEQKVVLNNMTKSSLDNYGRKIAQLCLKFNALPQNISDEHINQYLADLCRSAVTPSLSDFKHTVYGLRFYFKLTGHTKRSVSLPILKNTKKLPVVLSQQECKRLFIAPDILKHRIALMLIYSAGLRANELTNLKITDIDSERMMIHIRGGKGNKDRYVPLSDYILIGLRKYFKLEKPRVYLFNGKDPDSQYSVRGLQWALREALKRAKINKANVCLHTLRHSYATHLLEDGLDIVSIKELLGHVRLETTLLYLHVAKFEKKNKYSPLDKLYPKL